MQDFTLTEWYVRPTVECDAIFPMEKATYKSEADKQYAYPPWKGSDDHVSFF